MSNKSTSDHKHRIGRIIAGQRERLGLTQAEVARKMGMDHRSVSNMERGNHEFDYSTIRKLAGAFDMGVLELITEIESGDGSRDTDLAEAGRRVSPPRPRP